MIKMITQEYLVGQEDDFVWINGVTDSDLEVALGGNILQGTNNYGRFVTTKETIDRLEDRTYVPEVFRVVWQGDDQGYTTTVLERVEPVYARIVATYYGFRDKFPNILHGLDKLFADVGGLFPKNTPSVK